MKNKKLILIALDWTRPKDPPLSLGHASIYTDLVKNNCRVVQGSFAVNSSSFSELEVCKFIENNLEDNTDIALGAYVWNEKSIQNITKHFKQLKDFKGNIILGGPQISYLNSNEESFYPYADVFVKGYAENPLTRYMKQEKNIKGIKFANLNNFVPTNFVNLDELDSPFLSGVLKPQKFLRWETQRGCIFKCSFCQHKETQHNDFAKKRNFPINRVIKEIEWICENKIVQDIAVLDPTFNSGPNYKFYISKLISEGYTGKLSLQCRLEMMDEEFVNLICKLNATANVVLEFGLQTIHKTEQKAIERINNMKKIDNIIPILTNKEIKFEISLIFGLPFQTLDSFKQTISYCVEKKVPVIKAFPLMLLRGTGLFENKKNLGLIESTDIAVEKMNNVDRIYKDIPHVVESPTFSINDWKIMGKIANDLDKNYNIKF